MQAPLSPSPLQQRLFDAKSISLGAKNCRIIYFHAKNRTAARCLHATRRNTYVLGPSSLALISSSSAQVKKKGHLGQCPDGRLLEPGIPPVLSHTDACLMKFDNQNRQWHSGISRCREKG